MPCGKTGIRPTPRGRDAGTPPGGCDASAGRLSFVEGLSGACPGESARGAAAQSSLWSAPRAGRAPRPPYSPKNWAAASRVAIDQVG